MWSYFGRVSDAIAIDFDLHILTAAQTLQPGCYLRSLAVARFPSKESPLLHLLSDHGIVYGGTDRLWHVP